MLKSILNKSAGHKDCNFIKRERERDRDRETERYRQRDRDRQRQTERCFPVNIVKYLRTPRF